MFFKNRVHAGQLLAEVVVKSNMDLRDFDLVGIARGGVIIAGEIAKVTGLNVQSLLVKSLELTELTVRATSVGTAMCFPKREGPEGFYLTSVADVSKELAGFASSLKEKNLEYNLGREFTIGPNVLLCDDGLVSGVSVFTAIHALRTLGANRIVVAVPICVPWIMDAEKDFEILTWRVTKLKSFPSTGKFYFSFEDVPDDDVINVVSSTNKGVLVA